MDQIERKLRWNPSVKVGGLIYLLNIDQDNIYLAEIDKLFKQKMDQKERKLR